VTPSTGECVALIGGRKLQYLDIGTGPAIILIHGIAASGSFWRSTADVLADSYRVIAADLPGFGSSAAPETLPGLFTYSNIIADLMATLHIDHADVVGHSMGGLVAQRLSIDHPTLVRNLILVSSGDLSTGMRRWAVLAAACRSAAVLARYPLLYSLLRRSNLTDRMMGKMAVVERTSQTDDALFELFEGIRSPGFGQALTASISDRTYTDSFRIKSPTVVLQGADDRLVPVATAVKLAERIPNASLLIWGSVGHCAMLERPREFVDLIRQTCI
jgi:pimeloyl-ACP methyl ester carboxylesterase